MVYFAEYASPLGPLLLLSDGEAERMGGNKG